MSEYKDCLPLGVIDRGMITENHDDYYTVKSLDRPNITIKNLTDIAANSYDVGDKVYFFCFPDGTGRIICEL